MRKAEGQEKMIPEFLLSLFIFCRRKFLLGKNFIPRKKELLFESGGKVSATNRGQMSGNPV
jgi:hypothetical protein